MKLSRIALLMLLPIITLILSACSGALTASSWPGVITDQNNAYIAGGPNVFAVKLSDGSLAWKYPPDKAGPGYYAAPALTPDGQLIVGAYDNNLYSLNSQNGTLNWSFTPPKEDNPDRWVSSPAIIGEAIYAPNANHRLYKLDFKGNLLWKFTTDFSLWAPPADDGTRLYLPSMDHNLYAIDINTARKEWAADLGGALVGTPALSDKGVLFQGTITKEIVAVEAQTGKIVWRFPTEGSVWSTPALDGDKLYVGDMVGNLYALNTVDGSKLWSIKPAGPIIDPPLLTPDKTLVFGTESGALIAVDQSGKILWNHAINGKLYSTPVQAGDRILVPVTQGDTLLVAVDKNGNQSWSFTQPK